MSSRNGLLLRREPDGVLATHADLSSLVRKGLPWNEIVVDGRGNTYVNNTGFEFPGGQLAPGTIALLTPDGSARQVADGVAFPNGMAVTADNPTLIVAESYGQRLTAFDIPADGNLSNRRVWAETQAITQTGYVWMRRMLFGTQTSATNTAYAFARAVKFCKRSILTVDASLACWAVRTGERCSWWPPSGMVLTATWRGANEQAKY